MYSRFQLNKNAGWRCAYPAYKITIYAVGPVSTAPPGDKPAINLSGRLRKSKRLMGLNTLVAMIETCVL
ncbi:hypothetical protein D9S01_00680 [Salmonella enterica]|nr:hypothetical protein [Salmonella enterica]